MGEIVLYRLSQADIDLMTGGFAPIALGAGVGDQLPAVIVTTPSGSPASCNLRVFPNSTDGVLFLEAREQGSGNGQWSAL